MIKTNKAVDVKQSLENKIKTTVTNILKNTYDYLNLDNTIYL